MALTRSENQVTWSSSSSVTVSSATEVVSDAYTPDATCIGFWLTLSADNVSTAATTDTAIFRIRWSSGDILGDTGNDYDTAQHAEYICTLNTYGSETPGEDPARRTFFFPGGVSAFTIGVICGNAAAHSIVVRARVVEHRAA